MRELKNINAFIETELRPEGGKRQQPKSTVDSGGSEAVRLRRNDVRFHKLDKDSLLKGSVAKVRDFLPDGLNHQLQVREGLEGRANHMLPLAPLGPSGRPSESDSLASPDVYQDFFRKMQNLKQTHPQAKSFHSTPSDNAFAKKGVPDKAKQVLSGKESVPLGLERDPRRDMRIQHQILRHLEEQVRAEQESALAEEVLSSTDQRSPVVLSEFPVREGKGLEGAQVGMDAPVSFDGDNNPIYLKASSLFNDTILFENDLVYVSCRTDKSRLGPQGVIGLVLTMRPKETGQELICFVEDEQVVRAEPQNIASKSFENDFEQRVYLAADQRAEVGSFPVWNLTVGPRDSSLNIRLALPFTVNKFALSEVISVEEALSYREEVG